MSIVMVLCCNGGIPRRTEGRIVNNGGIQMVGSVRVFFFLSLKIKIEKLRKEISDKR